MDDLILEYTKALYFLNKDENRTYEVLYQIKNMQNLFDANNELSIILDCSGIKFEERVEIIESIFTNYNQMLMNFVKILVKQMQIRKFSKVVKIYESEFNKDNNIENLIIESVNNLNINQINRIIKTFENKLKKKVVVKNNINPQLIGGILIKTKSLVIDLSLAKKFNSLKQNLKDFEV